jgi:uncharacterized protein (DUF1810 family)
MHDPYNLSRFVEAQNPVYEQVLRELRQGCKTSHWMWFVFPQIQGLGHSFMARKFAISSLEEARAYLQHEVLGPRLRECTALVNDTSGRTIHQIFGSPDDLKFHSCMTLFAAAAAADADSVFRQALGKYFSGERDALTIPLLG